MSWTADCILAQSRPRERAVPDHFLAEIILPYYCRYRAYAKDYDVIGAFSIPKGTGGTSYSLGND